jgi:hypothetical protein
MKKMRNQKQNISLYNKPLIKDPKSVNYAAIGRAVDFSREYVRQIVLGIKSNPSAVEKVNNAIKKLTAK